MLRALTPAGCRIERMFYLDSVGTLLSLGNRVLLRQSLPTLPQIQTWDRRVIPVSRVMDSMLGYNIGRSVIAIWTRDGVK